MTQTNTHSYAIECDRLHLAYGFKSVLNDINLAIPQGAVVGLIGANGSGKSSLLRCIVGLQVPQAGEVRIFNTPTLSINDAIRERLGFVAQAADLFPWLTVEKHIKMIGQAYPRWQERRALELAIRLRLPMTREVNQLSSGDQQKLAVVLALAHQPDLIVMDEPVSSLDPMTRRDFMRSLFQDSAFKFDFYSNEDEEFESDTTSSTQQFQYHPTIIISSHLLSDLERVISHVAFIRDGRIQLFEEWDNVLAFIRIIPKTTTPVPQQLCIAENSQQQIVDIRKIRDAVNNQETSFINYTAIEAMPSVNNLDDLFIALNS
ncbi:ABC transporter ATP-binding protein [Undibacterium baiyunense]|uniref:ABC transporter ATP-binding protein n=1 Tax=Undibacterium baiyunense TaxID=2828731 RepID=A0A941DHP7_9BURK|nr:ABC transporter ATP-binding protein [Undibacterium baiyunense]MBR7747092.1 ABC transporter ATP-binding protein [Undibacterium baiyunense]